MDSKVVRTAIKLLLAVICLGICMMWIMLPTKTYQTKWRYSISNKVVSAYLGTEGQTMLVWTFPVLFVATLGSLYHHLEKNLNRKVLPSHGEKDRLAVWKKIMLVKGPLGIVSVIELAFLVMFLALLIWSLSSYLYNGLPTVTRKAAAGHGIKVWQMKLYEMALWIALVGNICLSFLFYPVNRGSSLLPLVGLTSEGSIKYHIWIGHLTLFLFTAHGILYIVYWAVTGTISEMVKWSYSDISNVAGEISLLGGLVLWAATIPKIRRKTFELFFYTHYLYIIFVFFFFLHVGIIFAFIMLPGFYLFMIDRFLRFLQSRRNVSLLCARDLSCGVVELNFAKTPGLSYNPTSIMFVNVPSISKLQWHPFTISSNSNLDPNILSVIIKSEGSWSTKLYQMLSSPTPLDRLEVSVEGPYGPTSNHFLRHEKLVMISGGSGITPFISIIRELIFRGKMSQSKTTTIILIAAFKNSSDLTMLDLLLPITGSPSELSNLQLQIEAYVTRDKQPATNNDNSKLIRSIWFKPHQTDKPMAAILGPNTWLWLAAIISSSFIIFLILIGIITRYYIYPMDHNKNEFSAAIKVVLNVLAICVSIATTASVAVFWNKRQFGREAQQIQHIDGPTPHGSPAAFINGDRELESLPNRSLVEATKIHYGQRPDLKKILLGFKGSSVGVLVSGPKKLRHDVAEICSSGQAENIHFESISFSW